MSIENVTIINIKINSFIFVIEFTRNNIDIDLIWQKYYKGFLILK